MSERKVTIIPATINPVTGISNSEVRIKRVAAYARVSTDSDEQLTSYEAQIDYYTKYIATHPGWEFAGMYADEGLTGVMTKNRAQFNQMITDAVDGKIDLILVKSISRFARNTVDTLTNVRLLKEKGVEVFFEKENISSLDSKGEVLLTIMGSLAQEESRSISANVTWGVRKKFQDGKVSIPYSSFLGYKKGADGLPEIVPEEAKIVRRIYKEFINGKSPGNIATGLTQDGIKTPRNGSRWQKSTVVSILTNEKYRGSARLQKRYTVDFLTKKTKINAGEVPQYYVEESHPWIIEPSEWDAVQFEMERRKNQKHSAICDSPFAGKVICGECGGLYGRKVWHSNDKYRKEIWQCNNKFDKNTSVCKCPHLEESNLRDKFMQAISSKFEGDDIVKKDLAHALELSDETEKLKDEIESTLTEMEVTAELIKQHISSNKDTDALIKKYERLEHKKATAEQNLFSAQESQVKLNKLLSHFEHLTHLPLEFDPKLLNSSTETIIVNKDDTLEFRFFDGQRVTVNI